ncbi:MAG: phosphatidylglycerol lysyltransferase domain-containing protein [Candidatus Hydrogenedentota bacterium]
MFQLKFDSFKNIEISDKSKIKSTLHKCNPMQSDYNFATLYVWKDIYKTKWTYIDELLIIYAASTDFILMPIGREINFDELLQISDIFKNENKKGNFTLVELCFIEKNKDFIIKYFKPEQNQGYSDYIYLTKKLVELKGQKLHKKKNLISQFLRNNPDYKSLRIQNSLLSECKQLAEKWSEDKKCDGSSSLINEKLAIITALDNFTQLDLDGLIISVKDNIIAFSIFSRQNTETYTVHFEKYNNKIKGSAQIINWETAKYLLDKCKYINREQDMGIPGLRQAKMSYAPVFLIKTYNLFRS